MPKNKLLVYFRQIKRQFRLGNLLILVGAGFGFLTLAVAVWSIKQANWINPAPSLITTLALTTMAGIILAMIRIPGKLVIPLALILGGIVTVWQAVQLFTATKEATAFQLWWQTINNSRPSEASIYFAMFLILVTWLIGFISTWFIMRRRNAWIAAILGTVMLFVNLGNLPHENYYFLPLFFAAALVMLGAVYLAKKGEYLIRWADKNARRGIVYFSIAVVCIALVSAGTVYLVPDLEISNFGLKIDTTSINSRSVQELWFNIFASVHSKWTTMKSQQQEKLQFKDPIETGDTVHFVISAGRSDYWRTRRYDVYESWGWTSTIEINQSLRAGEPITYDAITAKSTPMTYSIENRLKTDIVLSAGEVKSADISTKLQTFTETNSFSPDRTLDIAAITSSQLIRPYQRYKVISSAVTATPEELTKAGAKYPLWITNHYLQLPETLPARVRTLSLQITNSASTPYDKAMAIKSYLNKLIYDQNTPAPPAGRDGVDYFLFSSEKGYCTHFASAMTVMLRSVGVPARLCTGYLRGELDKATGNYIIRSRNYHAWVEIYFPGYGWLEFEATPSRPATGVSETANDTDYNYTFSGPEELPFWMDEPTASIDVNLTAPSPYARRSLPWPFIYLFSTGVLLAVAAFTTQEFLGRWANRLKRVKTAAEAYNLMCYLANRGSSGPHDYETPLEFSQRLSRYVPWQDEAINTIAVSYLIVRYSPRKELGELDRIKMQKAWVQLCPSLLRHMLRLRKWYIVRLFWKPS